MNEGQRGGAGQVFAAFFKLGLTAFGGPIAHLGYFRAEFVERRRWLDGRAYADIVALSQFLPGPASSQTGFAIGLMRAGHAGALAAWAGFTAPSALALVIFSGAVRALSVSAWGAGLLHGLKLLAVAVVAQAVLGMARSLCPDRARAAIAVAALWLATVLGGAGGQLSAIALGVAAGLLFCPGGEGREAPLGLPVTRRAGGLFLAVFALGLALAFLPWGRTAPGLFFAFYRSGALVFGGGHVVLPLLRDAVVAPGFVSDADFLAGYGAAQAVPGPLFTFAAYLGATASGVSGALLGLAGIFLPGMLILLAALPFWDALRRRREMQAAMQGVNAAVVGLLGFALYDPVWTSAVRSPTDFALATTAFVALVAGKAPPLAAVVVCAAAGALLQMA